MNKPVSIIGVPLHLGQAKRGVDLGAAAIRYAMLQERIAKLGVEVQDLGDVPIPLPSASDTGEASGKLRHVQAIASVSRELASRVAAQLQQGRLPITLGGDHAVAIGSLAGAVQVVPRLGVIWFDAHTDINTEETTPTGNIHGMPLAIAIGKGHPALLQVAGNAKRLEAGNIVIVGARSIDPGEKALLKQTGISVFTMHEIDRLGISRVMEEAICIASRDTDGVHLSLDLDALDPSETPGVGTAVQGGLTFREASLAMEMMAAADVLTSLDVVEVNPLLDRRNRTAQVAVDLICSLLGERIL